MAIPSITQYVGPLPLWAWVLLGGGGLYLFEKHKGGGFSGSGGLLSGVLGTKDSAGPATSTGPTGPADNDAWAQDAIAGLMAQGYDGLQATSAIQSYLDGGSLDPSYNSLVSAAIKQNGAPPDLTPVASAPIMPTPTQPPAPPKTSASPPPKTSTTPKKTTSAPATKSKAPAYSTYKIKSGDTLSAIAKKNGTTVSALAKANNISDPNKIYAGHSIKIPK